VQRLTKRESYIKGIALSSAFNLVSKFVLFAFGLLVTFYFGAKEKTDIYWFLYNTLWLVITIFSSLNIAVVIPEAMRRRTQEGAQNGMRFFTFFLYLFLFTSLAGLAIFYLLDPIRLLTSISKMEVNKLLEYEKLIRLFVPLLPIMLMVSYLSSILNAYRYFTIPVLTGLFNNIVTLVFLVLLHKYLDIYVLLTAAYAGNLLNLIHLIYVMRRDLSWDFSPKGIQVGRLFKENFVMGLFGNVGNFLGKYALIYFTSGSGPGLLTAFTYGQKTATIPTDVITDQVSSVAAIRLNELTAQQEQMRRKEVFMRSSRMLVFILTPIAALFFFFGEPITALLYQRGAFGPDDVKNTGFFLRYLGFLLPLYGINTMVTRLYNAGQIIKFSTIYSTIANLLLIGLLWISYSYWGIWGLPIALLTQNVVNVLVAEVFMRLFFKEINYLKVLAYFVWVLALSMAICGGIYYLSSFLAWSWWIKLPFAGALFVGIYLGMNELFKINGDVSNYLRRWIPLK